MAAKDEPSKVPPRRKPSLQKDVDTEYTRVQFITNEEGFTLQQFQDEFSDKLPVFAMVTQGCLGLSDLTTFSVEQTMFCKAFVKQRRVIARDARGRTISVPINYQLKFRTVHSSKKLGEEQTLRKIVGENKLPIQVQFSVPGDVVLSISEDKKRVKDLSNLLLVDFCEETFLIANGVYGRHLDPKSMVVPLYLDDLLLSTVIGAAGFSPERWKPWYAELKAELDEIKIPRDMGDNDIAVFSGGLPGVDPVYDYIKPAELISYTLQNATDDEKNNPTALTVGSSSRGRHNDGRLLPAVPDSDAQVKPPPQLPPRSSSQKQKQSKTLCETEKRETTQADAHKTGDYSHIEHMDISVFSDVLKKLKLDKHVDRFKRRQVDGALAKDLTEEILKDDFHMNNFEILKLMKFIRSGHIPK